MLWCFSPFIVGLIGCSDWILGHHIDDTQKSHLCRDGVIDDVLKSWRWCTDVRLMMHWCQDTAPGKTDWLSMVLLGRAALALPCQDRLCIWPVLHLDPCVVRMASKYSWAIILSFQDAHSAANHLLQAVWWTCKHFEGNMHIFDNREIIFIGLGGGEPKHFHHIKMRHSAAKKLQDFFCHYCC